MLYLTSKIHATDGGCTETLMCAIFILSPQPFCLSTFYVVTAAATFYPLPHNSNAHSAIIYFDYDAPFETDSVTNTFDVFVRCLSEGKLVFTTVSKTCRWISILSTLHKIRNRRKNSFHSFVCLKQKRP
jgi:hypothetical protein